MNIYGYEIANEVVAEVGKFTILWNLFEDRFLSNMTLWNICRTITYDHNYGEDMRLFMVAQSHFYENLDSFIDHFVFTNRAIYQASDNQRRVIRAFLNNDLSVSATDRFYGCMILIKRFRNNLMHGIKSPECLIDQLIVFQDINGLLESLH